MHYVDRVMQVVCLLMVVCVDVEYQTVASVDGRAWLTLANGHVCCRRRLCIRTIAMIRAVKNIFNHLQHTRDICRVPIKRGRRLCGSHNIHVYIVERIHLFIHKLFLIQWHSNIRFTFKREHESID